MKFESNIIEGHTLIVFDKYHQKLKAFITLFPKGIVVKLNANMISIIFFPDEACGYRLIG